MHDSCLIDYLLNVVMFRYHPWSYNIRMSHMTLLIAQNTNHSDPLLSLEKKRLGRYNCFAVLEDELRHKVNIT
jgi:hypothetical protein